MHLTDGFDRIFRYLRLSVTDVCNFYCSYCLPNGYKKRLGSPVLSEEELIRTARVFSELGLSKIRLTGGEPTVRKDFTSIVQSIASLDKVKTLALTTNGYRLSENAHELCDAGISAINVSLDSLDAKNFHTITGHDRLHRVLDGLHAALDAGIKNVKVNTVYMKGVNDHEVNAFIKLTRDMPVSVRFIELMETGEHARFFKKHHKPVMNILKENLTSDWTRIAKPADAGPSQDYMHSDYKGSVGLIAPYSKDFCKSCNRLRFSSQGNLHLCLFGNFGMPMRELLQGDEQIEELKHKIINCVQRKSASHSLHKGQVGTTRNLSGVGG